MSPAAFRPYAAAALLALAAAAPVALLQWGPVGTADALALAAAPLALAAAAALLRDPHRGPDAMEWAACALAASVCGSLTWMLLGVLGPLGSVAEALRWAGRLGPWEAAAVLLPPAGTAAAAYLCASSAASVLRDRRERRRTAAASELYGRARLLARRHLRELARRRGILLGQTGRGGRSALIGYGLEGCALTIAPPRTGKGATIALNMLSPSDRGHDGSTVTIDPRGELFCIVARRRREMGRRVVLLDPFGVVAAHAAARPDLHLPRTLSDRYNPLDFIREPEGDALADIGTVLDALLTPPADGAGNSRHFHESARTLIGGYLAWVRFREPPHLRTLAQLHRLITAPKESQKVFADLVLSTPPFCGGLTRLAVETETRVGEEEGGSNFTTVSNQLSWLLHPAMRRHTSASSFDPADLADGRTDLFVVVPETMVDQAKAWLRLWITIPNAVSERAPLRRDLLLIVDEMPRLGLLQPLMDGYNLAAGRGVHFWCFAQSISALDKTWGKENRRILIDLSEVVQVLGFPRTDADGAEELSKALGTATFETHSLSLSASSQGGAGGGSIQSGDNLQTVRERLVTPDDLMTLAPDRQYVIASPKDMPRDPMHLHHARYWTRPDSAPSADPNPFVLRKRAAGRAA